MKGKPSPPALIERLARLAPSLAGVEQRKMFGYPALFLNGCAASPMCDNAALTRPSPSVG